MVPAEIDYAALAAVGTPNASRWEEFVREALEPKWLAAYRTATPWVTEVLEIRQGSLIFLFDAAPTLWRAPESGDDRAVAVWGFSRVPDQQRDRARLAGFVPNPLSWSRAGLDRGHLVAHAAGGGLDLNLFPQLTVLNRGRSREGRLWRRMESHAARHPGTPLFVRPIYGGSSWRPVTIEFGLLVGERLWTESFANQLRAPTTPGAAGLPAADLGGEIADGKRY
ncbi:MAG: hypothetical protein ACRDLM_03885 [Gaiellaceae bacterium]